MSLSRTEIEAMDRDELVETIVNLADKVDDQQARLEAMSRWKEATSTKLDRLADTNEQLREENAQLRERLDSIEATAEQAMTVASRGHDPDEHWDGDDQRMAQRPPVGEQRDCPGQRLVDQIRELCAECQREYRSGIQGMVTSDSRRRGVPTATWIVFGAVHS